MHKVVGSRNLRRHIATMIKLFRQKGILREEDRLYARYSLPLCLLHPTPGRRQEE